MKHEKCAKVNQGGGEMTEEGFVKISRKMISWGWFKDVNTAHLFLYCLMRANYQDAEWKGIKLKRGSFVTSLKHLSEETGLTLQQTRTALEHLISTKEITKQSNAKNTVIIVNNYEKYQDVNTKSNSKSTSCQHSGNKVATQSQHSGNKVATTDKKKKKYSHPYRDGNTAAAPARPIGDGLAAEQKQNEAAGSRKPGEVVSVAEIRRFAQKVYGGNDYNACDFRRGFLESGTMFPDDWQDIFIRFAGSSPEVQEQFLKDLGNGVYREKWGVFG